MLRKETLLDWAWYAKFLSALSRVETWPRAQDVSHACFTFAKATRAQGGTDRKPWD